ncbi:MAG: hypothetical protein JWP87_3963 [Labilithrix sp.]|nr:hypothetical protein [Labilithrix sp.]
MVTPRAHTGGARVSAWPHDGIVPIELWDVMIDGATLFERRDDAAYYRSLARAASSLRDGSAVRAGGARLPARAWDAVAIVGGALDEALARDAFDEAGIALDVVSADPFFAASHALEALAEGGDAACVVIDVGQTAIKGYGGSGRVHRPRGDRSAASRAVFAEDIAAVLAEVCGGRVPSFVLLGLPCEVTVDGDDVVLGPSTYPTAGGGVDLVREVLALAGLARTEAAIVNDAILAAWALARRSPCPTRTRLVLTVGLGIGAAVVAPDASAIPETATA